MALQIRRLYQEICSQKPFCESTHMPPTLKRIDSAVGVSVATKPSISARDKHISLKLHHGQELLARGTIALVHVPTSEQSADFLIKALVVVTNKRMIAIVELVSF